MIVVKKRAVSNRSSNRRRSRVSKSKTYQNASEAVRDVRVQRTFRYYDFDGTKKKKNPNYMIAKTFCAFKTNMCVRGQTTRHTVRQGHVLSPTRLGGRETEETRLNDCLDFNRWQLILYKVRSAGRRREDRGDNGFRTESRPAGTHEHPTDYLLALAAAAAAWRLTRYSVMDMVGSQRRELDPLLYKI